MSERDVLAEERNAYVDFKQEQNEGKARHYDEATATYRIVKKTFWAVVIGITIGLGFLGAQTLSYIEEKEDRLGRRSVQRLFFKAVAYEQASHPEHAEAVERLMRYFEDRYGEHPKSHREMEEYLADFAVRLNAPFTSEVVKNGNENVCEFGDSSDIYLTKTE